MAAKQAAALAAKNGGKVGAIYIETPANPTNGLVDIAVAREISGNVPERFAARDVALVSDGFAAGLGDIGCRGAGALGVDIDRAARIATIDSVMLFTSPLSLRGPTLAVQADTWRYRVSSAAQAP